MKANAGRTGIRGTAVRATSTNPALGKMAMLLAGLVLLVVALPPFFRFPWLGFWLVPLAAIYLFLLLVFPRIWLIVLPLATVGLDTSPFTGRFAYNELDLLFLVTLASGFLYGRYRFRVFSPSPAVLTLLLYLIVVALGYSGWAYFALPPAVGLDNPYYTGEYAYKSVKGLVWGVALVPMWGYLLAADKRKAVNALVTGLTGAALLLGLIVLWERGSLGVILENAAWYHVVSSLLDLSASYRVTGLFSDMHTGGSSLDGVVLLLLPATLYGVTHGKTDWRRITSAICLLTLAYVTLVGFTRASYATFGLSLIIYAALVLLSRHQNKLPPPFPLRDFSAALGAGLLAAVVAYRLAGSFGLACYGSLLVVIYVGSRLPPSLWGERIVRLVAVAILGLAVYAHFGSRWIEPSIFAVLLLTISLALSYLAATRFFYGLAGRVGRLNRLLLLAGLLVLPAVLAFALGGYQIKERVSRTGNDLQTREEHWANVIGSAGDGLFRNLLGNGIGSFPASFIGSHPQTVRAVGSFSVVQEQNRDVLRIGGGDDLIIGQRVSVEPYTNYSITVHLRTEQSTRVVVALCERNLIYASNFMPNCAREKLEFAAADNLFQSQVVEINSGRVGERRTLARWPTVMTIEFEEPGATVDIDAVEMSADGFNVLRNSSFTRGLDYWFFYNDFSHLPWHVKNIFLLVWFETGWLGLGLFLALIGFLVRANLARHADDSLLPVYTTGVVAICLFGLFGSPTDSARVSWIFYFYLAAGLAKLRIRTRSRRSVTDSGSPAR